MQRQSDHPAVDWLAPQGPREGVRHYAEVIRQRFRLIVGCLLVTTLVAVLYTKVATPSWKAESHLLVTPVSGGPGLIGLGLLTSSSIPGADVSTAASLVTTPEVAGLVAQRINQGPGRELLKRVSAVPVAQSNVVSISVTASNALTAQLLANAFAQATVQNRTEALHRQLKAIIPALQAQIATLPPTQRTGQGSLGERLASLQTLLAGPDPTVSVESLASSPTSPSWPRTKLTVIAGIFVGLLIGVGGAFALEGLDPRIHREENLRRIFRLPVLARVPRERVRWSRELPLRPGEISPAAEESYRMLRIALGLRGAGGVQRSVMITGASHAEGKSSVALNLAATVASAGHSVILVEADLRRPSLGGALALHTNRGKRGTAGVLMGEISVREALVPVPEVSDNLSVLLVEQAAPYLADGLLAASDDLVRQAEALADYVIFDSPPVTEVSDALPLSQHVDEVIIVARLGHTRVDQLFHLGEVLTRQGVRPAGLVIVTDDTREGSAYYAATPSGPRGPGARIRQIPALKA
jgi:Mrp family chromosome partitioning ATPase/capsular polysaccharide biosynthesis protein